MREDTHRGYVLVISVDHNDCVVHMIGEVGTLESL